MRTDSSFFLFLLFLLAVIFFASSLFPGKGRGSGLGRFMVRAGWGLLTAGVFWLGGVIIYRSVVMGFPALTKTYEGLLFFSWAIGAALVILSGREVFSSIGPGLFRRQMLLWGVLIVVLFIALASSPLVPDRITPPVPALRSLWLVMHVAFSFIGEAAFAVSFIAALIYLLRPAVRAEAERIASAAVAVGYPVYTIGALLFGAIWAQYAWGRYWGWDPKEVWALITWLIYTFYLHLRLAGKKKGRLPMLVLLIGFPVALFTFLGVNALAVGLHAYN